MITFLVSTVFFTLLLANIHLTLILLVLFFICISIVFKKADLLEFKENLLDDISIYPIILGYFFPIVLSILFQIFPSQTYTLKDNPSIKCHQLYNEGGIITLSECSDNKTYINIQAIKE